ncbi:MAG: ChbG/HpnK family deacetylase, partial [Trueperaceae bacterium]
MSRRLIVNADDLGMSAGVNRGIVEAHRHGIVTSTTVLVNAAAAEAGIARVLREAPAMGLGLHVNLTHGRPVLPPARVPSLVRSDGTFVSFTRGLGWPLHWDRVDVVAEVEAQFERFVELAGRLPDHLDSHQLVGSISGFCSEAMVRLARRHGLPMRRGGRSMLQRAEKELRAWGDLPEAVTDVVRRIPAVRAATGGMGEITSPDAFELRFLGERATVTRLLRILRHLPEGSTELVCHPGYASEDSDGYRFREVELRALTDPRVRDHVRSCGIELIAFADLVRQRNGDAGGG